MKSIKESDYIAAIAVTKQENYLPFHSCSYFLTANMPNQEDLLIKKSLYNSLSKDAKRIIRIVVNSPDEVLNLVLNSKLKHPTRKQFLRHLEKRRGKKKAKEIINELTNFANSL